MCSTRTGSAIAVCALTSDLTRPEIPGNVLLKKGEANLKKDSVVNISRIVTVNSTDCAEKIGSLSSARVRQIVDSSEPNHR